MKAHDAADAARVVPVSSVGAVGTVAWALSASTWLRFRRGEGVLMAVNLSLIALAAPAGIVVPTIVSAVTLLVMYAFNDLIDAPADVHNPKKDRRLIAAYLEHRPLALAAILAASLAVIVIAGATLPPRAIGATTAVLLANLVYSLALKGVPILDVAWCGLWGALYAAIVTDRPLLIGVVGLMTATCHLYQALDDRVADAASAVTTTAVRSLRLAHGVFFVLSLTSYLALRAPLGDAWALSAFVPFVLHLVIPSAHVGWLLTKAYYAVMWPALLWVMRASA